jgi:hypothetical protein
LHQQLFNCVLGQRRAFDALDVARLLILLR